MKNIEKRNDRAAQTTEQSFVQTTENKPIKITAVITAAGKGERAGFNKNKLLTELNFEQVADLNAAIDAKSEVFNETKQTVLEKTASAFDKNARVSEIVFTSSEQDLEEIKKIAEKLKTSSKVVLGGKTRSLSVFSALKVASGNVVLIHDGARPFVSEKTIDECIDGVLNFGSAIAALPCVNSIAELDENDNIIKCSRARMREVQTPQGFFTKEILQAYRLAEQNGDIEFFTDESGVFSKYVRPAHVTSGDVANKKLTYPEDFSQISRKTQKTSEKKNRELRVGTGFDLHRLTENRKLILGGVEIPHDKGLLGHSDADVLTHAVMDALLSAAALRDIGYYFSDKDERFKDISSMILLKEVLRLVKNEGYAPHNVSAVIQAQKPKLSPFVDKIRKSLAQELSLPISSVGISCTTLEGLGIVGREEGIAVTAYCSIEKILNMN